MSKYVQGSVVWLYSWCAPLSPISKKTRSPALTISSPSGVRKVAEPEMIRNNSSACRCEWYNEEYWSGSNRRRSKFRFCGFTALFVIETSENNRKWSIRPGFSLKSLSLALKMVAYDLLFNQFAKVLSARARAIAKDAFH